MLVIQFSSNLRNASILAPHIFAFCTEVLLLCVEKKHAHSNSEGIIIIFFNFDNRFMIKKKEKKRDCLNDLAEITHLYV